MKKNSILFLILALLVFTSFKAQIPSKYIGVNSWMPKNVGTSTSPCGGTTINLSGYSYYPDGRFYPILNGTTIIQESGVKLLRHGGTAADINALTWGGTTAQWDEFILAAQSIGAEPVIQIPFLNQFYCDGMADTDVSAANAISNYVTSLVTYIMSNYPRVKYYSIGNEPDRYNDDFGSSELTAIDIGKYFRKISEEIKTIYATNNRSVPFVIGPDLSEALISTLMPDLIGGSGDITGQITSITSGTYYFCDIYTYHTYPFSGTQSRTEIIDHPSLTYFSDLTAIRARIASPSNNNPALQIALTEFNVNYENNVNNTAADVSANSFIAGQWMAEMFATGLRPPSIASENAMVAFMTPWSVHEGLGAGNVNDLGLLNGDYDPPTTTTPPTGRSTYYHLKMMANNFNGKFHMGSTNNSSIKVFGSKSCTGISVMIMNQDDIGGTKDYKVNLSGTLPSTGSYKGTVNMGNNNIVLTGNINQEETILYVMDACGKIKTKYTYNVGDAQLKSAPTEDLGSGRFCRCYDFTPYNPSNSTAKCATPGGGSGHFNNDNLNKSFSLIGNVGSVTGILKVTGNSVLTIQDAEMVFAPGAKIEVQPGSKLIIKNSYLHGCEGGQKWTGMDIMGNNILSGQISIDGSQIWDAQVAVKANNVKDIFITGTSFHDGITAIEMERVQGFQIANNEIASFTYGIKTSKTIMSSAAIKENYFYDVKYAVFSEYDNHAKLEITCNKFEKYSDYAIYSDNSIMKDQGNLSNGAGNEFISNSTQLNHKLRHNGNQIKYYYDPSNPVSLNTSSGLKAIAQMAGADAACSSASARLLDNTSANENLSETSKSLLAKAFDFNVYPNPFNNSFIVSTNSMNASLLEIYNVYGSLIYSVNLANEQTEISLDKYTSGIYFVKMSNHQGSVIKKIIKE